MNYYEFLHNLHNYSDAVREKGEQIADNSVNNREDRVIRIKQQTAGGVSAVTAKVLDEFNYVSHVRVTLDADGGVNGVSCDCSDGRSGRLCEHTAALLARLVSEQGVDGGKSAADKDAVSLEGADMTGADDAPACDDSSGAASPSQNDKAADCADAADFADADAGDAPACDDNSGTASPSQNDKAADCADAADFADVDAGELFTDSVNDFDEKDIMLGLDKPLADDADSAASDEDTKDCGSADDSTVL
ncbi:SWIM zinc finger family protein [uncultured Ruminococcus sp.]|uniref:SWIM zinc finger family protein n=1 Tax=uncultured Ruminococcus sp. TaxID=165186 RepID=UPI0025D61FF8|nr:SWIM zinc finger family protein [uncultured Ruminococcus sp.]